MQANYEKDHNYLLEGRRALPTHAYVYRDGAGIWHYQIYSRRYKLDPIASQPELKSDEGSETSESQIRAKAEAEVKVMYQAAGWAQPNFSWPASTQNERNGC